MKRILGKIVSLILAVMVMTGLFASCELVAVNVDKDMTQKVAEVKVEGYATSEAIYKREVMAGYLNYGYYYVSQGTYTPTQAFEVIVDNLTGNRVIVQYSKMELDKDETKKSVEYDTVKDYLNLPTTDNAYMNEKIAYIKGLLAYVDEVQVAEAVYNTRNNLKALVDSLDEEVTEETEEVEDETITALTTPTVEAVDGEAIDEEYLEANEATLGEKKTVEELSEDELNAYNTWLIEKYTSFSMAITTSSQKTALSDFVKAFVSNGILFENEFANLEKSNNGAQYVLSNYSYYLDNLASNIESFIIANYENSLKEEAEGKITDEALYAEYCDLYQTQKATYSKDLTAYETALDALTKDSLILYHPVINGDKYGQVANLLVGFGNAATNALKAWDAANTDATVAGEAKRIAYRDSLLASLTAKDQRATWLQNGYYEVEDKTADVKSYAFGDDYVKTASLKTFNGTFVDNTDYTKTTTVDTYFLNEGEWAWGEKEVDDYKANFANIVAAEVPFESFYAQFLADLGAGAPTAVTGEVYDYKNQVTVNEANLQTIADYMFAYGTDPGSHNKYLGYLYSPKTSATTYVKEFAEGAKYAVGQGVGTCVVVATDYGYHVMICTAVYGESESTLEYADVAAFTAALAEDTDNTAKKFKEAKENANFEQLISDIVTYSISKYVDEEGDNYAVKVYEKALKNLIYDEQANA